MRVLIISGSALPIRCGVAYYTDHLVQQLRRLDVDVRVVTHAQATGSDTVHNVVQRWSPRSLALLTSAVRDFQPDIVHFMYPSVTFPRTPFVNLLPHLLKWRFRKPPLVVTLHEYHDASTLGRIRSLVTAGAADLLVVSNSDDHDRLRRLPFRRLVTVPLGNHFPVAAHNPERAAALRRRYAIRHPELVGFVGFVDAAKGVDRAIRAVARLEDRPALLLLSDFQADDPLHRQLQALARELDVTLYWPGHLHEEEVSLLMQECRMMVFPFRQPVSARRSTFVTSLVHGCPTIATGTTRGPFVDAGNCLLLPEMTPGALAASIDRLRNDRQLRRRLAMQARRLEALFDWQRTAATYVALYEELLAHR